MFAGRLPALVLLLWAVSTLGWWAFAFAPLPAAPPDWLETARLVCFGAMPNGLPELQGWMLLVLTPASFLGAILVLWGGELPASLARAARSRLGRTVLATLLVTSAVEGSWVAARVHAALVTSRSQTAIGTSVEPLPSDYPRQAAPAPDFALVDQRGETVSLAALRGRPVVVTFVFAHCRTMCPLIVEAAKRGAPPGSEVLLVTLDPWRDTPSTLPGLARQWELPENFRALSSRGVERVLDVARAYGVPFERNETTGDISHPGLLFVIDADGRLAYTFNNPPAEWIAEGVKRLG